MSVTETAGRWDVGLSPAYFLAVVAGHLKELVALNYPPCPALVAVNELKSQDMRDAVRTACDAGWPILLDSGIFNLASAHATKTGITHSEALSLPPSALRGWEGLRDLYLTCARDLGPSLWGYIELDLGGAGVKRTTRAWLESEGLRPIPVYHPLSDGEAYFHELASQYDRICLGNVVQAPENVRTRLLATLWQWRREHPTLRWMHVLGYTPDGMLTAYPTESADSSTWSGILRWRGQAGDTAAGARVSRLDGVMYEKGGDYRGPTGYINALQLGASLGRMRGRNWHRLLRDYEREGFAWCPPLSASLSPDFTTGRMPLSDVPISDDVIVTPSTARSESGSSTTTATSSSTTSLSTPVAASASETSAAETSSSPAPAAKRSRSGSSTTSTRAGRAAATTRKSGKTARSAHSSPTKRR